MNMSTLALDPLIPDTEHLVSEEDYKIYDTLIAVILSLCTVVGLPGNLFALTYFYSASRRDFSSFIYIIVCGIDIWTCLVHLPVTIALFNTRTPGIFDENIFCVAWIVVFYYLQKMSMFLVMLMSVSRTITLIYLRYKIKKKFLLTAFLAYTVFFITWEIIIYIFRGSDSWYGYSMFDVYCWRYVDSKPLAYTDHVIRAIFIGCPPILTTISFIVFAYKLLRRSSVSSRNKRKHQAAVTMAMFTTLFLVCNLPCSMNYIMYFVDLVLYDNGVLLQFSEHYSHPFMAYYSWVISDILTTVLNATLNPVLYLCRMSNLREWASSRRSRRTQNGRSSRGVPQSHTRSTRVEKAT